MGGSQYKIIEPQEPRFVALTVLKNTLSAILRIDKEISGQEFFYSLVMLGKYEIVRGLQWRQIPMIKIRHNLKLMVP